MLVPSYGNYNNTKYGRAACFFISDNKHCIFSGHFSRTSQNVLIGFFFPLSYHSFALCTNIFFYPPNSFLTSKVLTMCSILFQQVIWGCLVEDSALFLRHVLERLTRDHQDEMFKLLRHLIRFIPRLPQQAAFALYNYIIGYVMFYVRSPHEDGQRLIGAALSILWMVRFM